MDDEAATADLGPASGKMSGSAAAVWRPDTKLAQIYRHSGKLLTRMGFTQKGHQYLHIEEAVYLMGRSLLELFMEGVGVHHSVDIQQAMSFMVDSGYDVERFLVYAHLMQGSLIVRRQPARWSLDHDELASEVWRTGFIPSKHSSDLHAAIDEAFIVFAPNSNFSRKTPDPPVLLVCSAQESPPTRAALCAAEATSHDDVPIAFATVSGGDVSIYTFHESNLPSLL